MTESFEQLRSLLARISDISHASALLEWDQETYMPDGAAESRGLQVATLRQLAHELLVSDELGRLLEEADPPGQIPPVEGMPVQIPPVEGMPVQNPPVERMPVQNPPEQGLDSLSDAASLVRIARKDRDRAMKIPSDLVAELAIASAAAKQAWKSARESDDYSVFAPHLQTILNLTVRKAEALGYDGHIYDALLDEYEPDMKTDTVDIVFADLRTKLVPIVHDLTACDPPDDSMLHRHFPRRAQWEFGESIIRDFGYDFNRGRQDVSAHPFTTTFSISDVRLTTRIDERFFNPGFFGTLHEAGHGMYEQGIDPVLERTPLADGTSLGMHESQSRLWENQIGRSRAFWEHYYPRALEYFPEVLSDVSLDRFYRAINRVSRSLIRVEADEVTYNLHIMVRFELEKELVAGSLSVNELPGAWNDRMEAYLGVRPSSDAEGALQDIHWSLAAIGYFPTYALGNLMSAQLFDRAAGDIGDLTERIGSGSFSELLDWLRRHVHRFGRKKSADQILRDTTGGGLSAVSWIHYIQTKYEVLYGM